MVTSLPQEKEMPTHSLFIPALIYIAEFIMNLRNMLLPANLIICHANFIFRTAVCHRNSNSV